MFLSNYLPLWNFFHWIIDPYASCVIDFFLCFLFIFLEIFYYFFKSFIYSLLCFIYWSIFYGDIVLQVISLLSCYVFIYIVIIYIYSPTYYLIFEKGLSFYLSFFESWFCLSILLFYFTLKTFPINAIITYCNIFISKL